MYRHNNNVLQVEWYRNGEKLPTGHRFRTFHDFGIVILDILYCYEEDSGEYECRAVNKVGSDVTKATLKCVSKESLILTPQIPKVSSELDQRRAFAQDNDDPLGSRSPLQIRQNWRLSEIPNLICTRFLRLGLPEFLTSYGPVFSDRVCLNFSPHMDPFSLPTRR